MICIIYTWINNIYCINENLLALSSTKYFSINRSSILSEAVFFSFCDVVFTQHRLLAAAECPILSQKRVVFTRLLILIHILIIFPTTLKWFEDNFLSGLVFNWCARTESLSLCYCYSILIQLLDEVIAQFSDSSPI